MKRYVSLLLALAVAMSVAAFGPQPQQATTQVQPQQAAPPKPQKTVDANVDPNAKVGIGHGDMSKDEAAMMDTATCTHMGSFHYNIDPYGQLSLVQNMTCSVGGTPIPTTSSAFLCQLDATLQCDNTKSKQVMNKVTYGQNVYAVTAAGVAVGNTRYPWLDTGSAANALPLIKMNAAKQIAAYQKIFNTH